MLQGAWLFVCLLNSIYLFPVLSWCWWNVSFVPHQAESTSNSPEGQGDTGARGKDGLLQSIWKCTWRLLLLHPWAPVASYLQDTVDSNCYALGSVITFSNVPSFETHINTIVPWSQTTEAFWRSWQNQYLPSLDQQEWQVMKNVTMTVPHLLLSHFKEFTKTMIHLKIKFFLEIGKPTPPVAMKHQLQWLWCSLFGKAEMQSQDTGENGIDSVCVHQVQPWEVFTITLKSHFWPSEDWRCQRKPVEESLGCADVYQVPVEEGFCCVFLEG